MNRCTLRQILARVDPKGVLDGGGVDEGLLEMGLTYAETVLLTEGVLLGYADCSLGPYVTYEAVAETDGSETVLRSVILEFFLSGKLRETSAASESVRIEGAVIVSAPDLKLGAVLGLYSLKENLDHRFFSLDLGNRTVSVDMHFTRCHFLQGINFRNSSLKNLMLEKCSIGKTTITDLALNVSILGENARINGNLTVTHKPPFVPTNLREQIKPNIAGDIRLSHLMATGSTQLENCEIEGEVAMVHSKVENLVSISRSVIYGISEGQKAFDGHNLTCSNLLMEDLLAYGRVEITFGKVKQSFSCVGARLFGSDVSLNAAGIVANSIFLRDGFFALHGVALFKAEIGGDVDCSNAFFGWATFNDNRAPALNFRKSRLKNVLFSAGITCVGALDLAGSEINTVTVNQGLFCSSEELDDCKSGFAIMAENCTIHKEISFNPPRESYLRNKLVDDFHFAYRHIRLFFQEGIIDKIIGSAPSEVEHAVKKYFEILKSFSTKTSDKYGTRMPRDPEQKARLAILEQEILNGAKHWEGKADEKVDYWRTLRADLIQKYKACVKALARLRQVCDRGEYADVFTDWSIDRYCLVLGGASFERAMIAGTFDAAGGFFYREGVDKTVSRKRMIFGKVGECKKALALTHATVGKTLYLNHGDVVNQLPFVTWGEVDLQYASINVLSVTPYLAIRKGTRWNLIGATYMAIDSQNNEESRKNVSSESTFKKFWERLRHKWSLKLNVATKLYWTLLTLFTALIGSINAVVRTRPGISSARWIYPYFGRDNFRQPFQQLSNTLFKDGDDVGARRIIVYRTPTRNVAEELLYRLVIRPFFWLAFPVHRAFTVFLILFFSGVLFFCWGEDNDLIVDLASRHANTTDLRTISRVPFEKWSFTIQKLLPLVDGEQEKNFGAVYSVDGPYSIAFLVFYVLYPLLGTYFLAMFILGLARVKRNG